MVWLFKKYDPAVQRTIIDREIARKIQEGFVCESKQTKFPLSIKQSLVLVIIPLQKDEFETFQQFFHPKAHACNKGVTYESYELEGFKMPLTSILLGEMGVASAADKTSQALNDLNPDIVVLTGIGGATWDTLKIGDVVIADEINEYMASSKAVTSESENSFRFERSGSRWRANDSLVSQIRTMITSNLELTNTWMAQVRMNRQKIKKKYANLDLPPLPTPYVGHIASGDTVVASKPFKKWILESDRKTMAVDMEAAGVMRAAHRNEKKTLVIRGMSDYGDEAKAVLDETEKGIWRRYAMFNVFSLLVCLLKNQDFQDLFIHGNNNS
jgi:nucleoside phosphorylase